MIINGEDLKVLENVPAGKWHEVMELAHRLAEENRKIINSGKTRDKPRLWGVLEGKVWMSDDFNDPMDFISPEEAKVLEAMRSRKKKEVQHMEKQEAVI